MEHASRRNFLITAGAGTAAVAAAATPLVRGGSDAPVISLPEGAVGAMAAYIHDVEKGEVTLMIEDRQVVVTDHELVARLAQAFHAAGR